MLINGLLCLLSTVVTVAAYAVFPALSVWWIPLFLVGGYAVWTVLLILSTLVFSCFMKTAKPSAVRRRLYRLVSHIAKWVLCLCGTRVYAKEIDLLPNDRPFLLVCNHLSAFDPIVTLAALHDRELAFVSKPENFRIPLIGAIMRNASFLPIDRENPRNAVTAIKQAASNITARNLSMGIYPEGTRNKAGSGMLPFHNGSFKIATTAKCPVAVLTIRYETGTFPYRRHAYLSVKAVLDEAYVTQNRTDAISMRAREFMEK